jgi:Uma2 family endonuclease
VAAILPERVRPLRRVEYERMAELGLFGEEKIELLRGFLVAMGPQGTWHAAAVQCLTHLMFPLVTSGRAAVRVQLPFAAGDSSEPEPDLALVPPGTYRDHHPSTAFLVIEVSDSSLAADRGKAEIYAASGVSEYWIVDAANAVVEVHAEPVAGAYSRVTLHRAGAVISPSAFPELAVPVTDVVG